MSVVETLSEVWVSDLEGQPVRLGTLWETKTVVLVFVRHYG